MRRFTQLFCELDQTTRTGEKVAALENYFREASPADAAWALQFLCGRTISRVVSTKSLRRWVADESQLPDWLIEECYDSVGDLAETMALLLPGAGSGTGLSLAQIVEQRLLVLKTLPESGQRALLIQTWRELDPNERLVWNKLITGNFRVGVARTLVVRALATVAGIEPALMAHRIMGGWEPTAIGIEKLLSGEGDTNLARPYPFFLASPLEMKIKSASALDELGNISEWQVEWKWDGIRAQLIRRSGETLLWSRGDEMVTDSFPEIIEAGEQLPDGTVLDGEILAWRDGQPLPFGKLQRRLGRRTAGEKIRQQFPVAFVAYDLLEIAGKDFRSEPLGSRRQKLEQIVEQAAEALANVKIKKTTDQNETPLLPAFETQWKSPQSDARREVLQISPMVNADSWEELARFQSEARKRGVEGLMLKRVDSKYGVGRQRGDWWKWKIDPLVIDAVLVSAQRGHGRRASLYTDYTFALWDGAQLVPVAKAYSGLTDEEILRVDSFVRHHTTGKFGPVRSVEPKQVFELAFEGVQKSTRHKSGIAVRFPRMNRWRRDKKPEEADTLDNLRALANFDGIAS